MQSQLTIDWKVEQDVRAIITKTALGASMGSSSTARKWFTRTTWSEQSANAARKHTGGNVGMHFVVNAAQRQQDKTLELHQTSNGHTTVRLINGGVLREAVEAFFEEKHEMRAGIQATSRCV